MENINKKILLVDDDEMLRNIYAENFEKEGFIVTKVKNGKEALDILNSGNIPNIVLTGIKMPEMSGFELIEQIKSMPSFSALPIAISSHRGLPEDKKKAQELQVDDFIIQSETPPNEVVRRIKYILGMRDKIRVAFNPEIYDGKALINLLNKQQGTYVNPFSRELVMELEPQKEPGTFKIKIIS